MPYAMPSRLVLIDQSLTGFQGHHYEYATAILRAARELGLGVGLATHHTFPDASLAGAPVVGRFTTDWYATHRSRVVHNVRRALRMLPGWLRLPLIQCAALINRYKTPISDATAPAPAFGTSLSQIIDAQKLTDMDHVLVPTISGGELRALVGALSTRTSLPHLHIVLRRDIEGDGPAQENFKSCIETIRGHVLLLRRFHFYTDTAPLAEQYHEQGRIDVGVLPIPHCLPSEREKEGHSQQLTIVYLGNARSEKGYDLLPGLIAALADTYLKTSRVRFVVQSNYELSLEEPAMAKARQQLLSWPANQVEIIDEPLDMTSFHTLLFKADIVLLPYRAAFYRRRSSGVLVLAAAAGVPTVVPARTWLAAEAPESAHIAFGNGLSLVEAVRLAIENNPSLTAAARAAALEMRAKHDAERLVRMVIRGRV